MKNSLEPTKATEAARLVFMLEFAKSRVPTSLILNNAQVSYGACLQLIVRRRRCCQAQQQQQDETKPDAEHGRDTVKNKEICTALPGKRTQGKREMKTVGELHKIHLATTSSGAEQPAEMCKRRIKIKDSVGNR